MKKDAIEISILLSNELKSSFKKKIFELTGPFIDMMERSTMIDSVLEWITNSIKVLTF
jgi:hypothetical protein